MKTYRIALATTFCCLMIALAATAASAQITDPGDGGGSACTPSGSGDFGFHATASAMPWRTAILAFRDAFAPGTAMFRLGSPVAVRATHLMTRGSARLVRH